MSLTFDTVTGENKPLLQNLMVDYYRAGEYQSMAEDYVQTLLDLVEAQVLDLRLGMDAQTPVGFVLFTKDRKGTDFTEVPGCGTVMELYVVPELRGKGFGTSLVQCAEELLARQDVKGYYICGYQSADGFWEKLGYRDSGEKATNEQPLWVKAH